MAVDAHPDSLVRLSTGRTVALKVHECLWSGEYPANSLPAIAECYRAGVARAEIDINALADADFLVTHDPRLDEATTGSGPVRDIGRSEAARLRIRWRGDVSAERPPLLSEVVDAIRAEPFPSLLELDVKDFYPWPWPRVEELARIVEPVKDRIVFGACEDWNLRRLRQVDPGLTLSFNPAYYLDAPADGEPEPLPVTLGAYGYLDDHPLARWRLGSTGDYLRDRFDGLLCLVPEAVEWHLSLDAAEQMLDDDVNPVDLLHQAGLLVDLWTLDAGTPGWLERLRRAVGAGADVITTNTPAALAAALRAE